jgi:glycosyltransferase involved in cell wall biosynthesis
VTGEIARPMFAAPVGLVASETFDDPTGIGTYTRQLADRLPHRVEGLRCVLDDAADESPAGALAIPRYLRAKYVRRVVAPFFLARRGLRLLHFPTEASMYLVRTRSVGVVVTVHGLASIRLPAELHERLPRRAWFKYRQLLESADRVITVSESSKRDIVDVYDVAADRITVVYNGIDEVYTSGEPLPYPSFPDDRPFLLSVGVTHPKKNISAVLRALAALKERGLPHRLVHIGPPGIAQAALEAEVRRFNLRNDVIFGGYVQKAELAAHYRAAAALVFPSFHEGFGIPIVEAMASGCPVVTSTAFSMPEVAGDAALLVDPYDVEALISVTHRLLVNKGLREEMIGLGLQRARRFSWNRCADETAAVYKAVLEKC